MKRIYTGKTKDVFKLDENHVVLQFKDDVTGSDGVFDPGANTVGLTLAGAGKSNVKMTSYFFEKLEAEGVPTHYVSSDLDNASLTVKNADMLGHGLEMICRYRAVGSFLRRYGAYCEKHQKLDGVVEITIKDDEREDPPISKDALLALSIVTKQEYETIISLTKKVSNIVKDEFAQKGLDLYDIKLEFGRDPQSEKIIVIDEISSGNMRVYQNEKQVDPLELNKLLFSGLS